MTVLDVGAHHGYYTLLTSVIVGKEGKVIAFEPSSRERARLHRHILLNRCTNVQVESSALGSETGEAKLFVANGREDWCNSLRSPATTAPIKLSPVKVIRMDDFLATHEIEKVDLVKLDVEGGELDVLRGSKGLLEGRPRPIFLAEVQDIRTKPWGYSAKEIIEHMVRCGFRWHRISEDGSLEPLDMSMTEYDGNFVAWPIERPLLNSK
jgi:FkbM family methyltransferase